MRRNKTRKQQVDLNLPIQKFDYIPVPTIANVASKYLQLLGKDLSSEYANFAITKYSGISAVERIMKYGRTEKGELLKDTKWFRQQIRITADNRIKYKLTTGASQISKSLVNYLCCVDDIISGNIDIGWFYASRQSMINQQPQQFQAIAKCWIEGLKNPPKVYRDSVTRFRVGNAIGNFTYVNSDSAEKSGGAAEAQQANAFSCSKIYLEERSSYKANVDVTPRLGASRLVSAPIIQMGTPGSGSGIEKDIKEAAHYFLPGVRCNDCEQITFLEPKGALLKGIRNNKNGRIEYFGLRGEILDYFSEDGTPRTAYVACQHCGCKITPEQIEDCDLISKQSQQTVDEFLDELPDEIYFDSVAIYLSPLLRVPDDPFRLQQLIADGLEPENSLIYCQNKLGYPSELGSTGVTIDQFDHVFRLKPHQFQRKTYRIAGIDQNRGLHHIVIGEVDIKGDWINLVYVGMISQSEIILTLKNYKVDYCLIDNEPDRIDTYKISLKLPDKLALADQRDIRDSFKLDTVRHGDEEIPCYLINNQLYIELFVKFFDADKIRFDCKLPKTFQRHVTSVRQNPNTGKWERPPDHEDHFFFSVVFLMAAIDVFKRDKSPNLSTVNNPKSRVVMPKMSKSIFS